MMGFGLRRNRSLPSVQRPLKKCFVAGEMFFLEGLCQPGHVCFRVKQSACAFLVLSLLVLSHQAAKAYSGTSTNARFSNRMDLDDVTTLTPGVPTTRQIKGGERHLFQFAAAVGQYIHVTVRPTRIILQ